jgi:hypothetical protein
MLWQHLGPWTCCCCCCCWDVACSRARGAPYCAYGQQHTWNVLGLCFVLTGPLLLPPPPLLLRTHVLLQSACCYCWYCRRHPSGLRAAQQ